MKKTTSRPGERLRAARLAAGLTQAAAAKSLGVTVQTYGDYERGRRNPTLDWLWAASRAIGCNPAEIDDRLAPLATGATDG
jgi:transcriptional regulator with XRE-family HTH domain